MTGYYIQQYKDNIQKYQLHASRIETLLIDILNIKKIKVHFTESRAKSHESLLEKISRPGKSYENPLVEIPDLVGIRIVLYYQDDVGTVGDIIRQEFDVIEEEKSHHVDRYSPDRFGYISAHYVVKINHDRAKLVEWVAGSELHAEIQVRTVLQHSWAAVSHVLQYKREGDVPVSLRRKLFRLASLFELADEQFIEIREERGKLKQKSQEILTKDDDDTRIDISILENILNTSKNFHEIVNHMKKIGFSFVEVEQDYDYLGGVVEELERLDLATVGALNTILSYDYSVFLKDLFERADRQWDVSDSFALYLIVIASNHNKFSVEHLIESDSWAESIATTVLESAKASIF